MSSIDLTSSFWQQRLIPSDSLKSAINTRYGQFSWSVMAMGLKNSGARWMYLMNDVLKEYIDDFVICYIDNCLIYTKGNNIELHKKHLHMVFKKLHEAGLVVSKAKWHQAIESQKKVDAIASWPVPETVQDVRKFMDPLTEEDPELIAEDVLARIRVLKEKRFEAKEQMIVQARKDKERWDAALKGNKVQTFAVGDYVMLRHESKKIQEIEGKASSSWVHTDRLHYVQYDGAKPQKSWYIPRIARAK